MRALVTGGAGFIGSHLVAALVARGDEVRVIDDLSSGHRDRLAPHADRIVLVEGSILDSSALDQAMDGCEVVFHHAAIASVRWSVDDPAWVDTVNVRGTIEVMLAAARNHARRVVFAGSSAVYGVPESLPCRETQRTVPELPYGVSKLAAEHYVRVLGTLHGVETTTLRYFNVFGPGQDPESEYAAVIPRFATAVVEGRQPTIFGTGRTSRDFIHIDDVVSANLLAARASSPSGITCNIASGHAYSLLQLLGAIGDAAGRSTDPEFAPARPGDIEHSLADIAAAERELGYMVSVPFEEGIARTVAWYTSQRAAKVDAVIADG